MTEYDKFKEANRRARSLYLSAIAKIKELAEMRKSNWESLQLL